MQTCQEVTSKGKLFEKKIKKKEQNVHVFCPTHQTVQGSTLGSILKNHTKLTELWEFSVVVKEKEIKASMKSFKFYFDCQLGERLLAQTNNLNQTFQNRDLSVKDAIIL